MPSYTCSWLARHSPASSCALGGADCGRLPRAYPRYRPVYQYVYSYISPTRTGALLYSCIIRIISYFVFYVLCILSLCRTLNKTQSAVAPCHPIDTCGRERFPIGKVSRNSVATPLTAAAAHLPSTLGKSARSTYATAQLHTACQRVRG